MAACRSTPSLLPPSRLYGAAPSFHFAKPPSIRLHLRSRSTRSVIVAAQSNLLRVVQTAVRVGKDAIETGTNFVPDSVPRPIARIGVGVVAVFASLFLLKSVISTAFFVLAMMGAIYFVFVALNSDDGSKGGGKSNNSSTMSSEEESLEEARRIMEKYK
ncbi:hypothetical protein LUZ60_006881 [Juncus effusus]|nr:hypothetical protein LUZ60_006881 [Juncus effusus]